MPTDQEVFAFLSKDYELKVRYLTDHFSRMWTRFNFFVGIESAIAGGKVVVGEGKLSAPLAILGASVALVWYVMGAEDRFLVDLYRRHVADAAKLVTKTMWSDDLQPYRHVGEVKESSKTLEMSLSGWRREGISTTRLAAWIPLLVFVGWMAALMR
jgi:hypothetical protein